MSAADDLSDRYRASPVFVVELPVADARRSTRPHLVDRGAGALTAPRALCGYPLPAGYRIHPYPPTPEPGPCRRCAAQLALRSPATKGDPS